ncbi:MAG TPA: acyl-CoA dehydrogenase family protein, partial [Mycobacteriales bacterium]
AGSFAEITEALTVLAAGCASTAWCASIAATLGRMAAYLPAEGQSEVWARGPDAFICGALMPAGRAESVDGGYRVSGEWAYMSGVEFSDWALVCSTVAVGERPEVRFFLVPRSAYRITDTWFNLGMRGTGSNTLVLGETFVPGSRSFTRDELVEGRAADATAACHNVPLRAVNSLSFAAPALGAARGAARTWSALVAPKIRAFTGNNRISGGDRGTLEIAFARATGEMDAAQLLVDRAAGIADQGAVTVEHTLRNARDSAVAVDLLASAVNRLFRVVGTRGQSEGHPFQRFWRDVHTATGHTVLQVDPAASAYGNHVLLRET